MKDPHTERGLEMIPGTQVVAFCNSTCERKCMCIVLAPWGLPARLSSCSWLLLCCDFVSCIWALAIAVDSCKEAAGNDYPRRTQGTRQEHDLRCFASTFSLTVLATLPRLQPLLTAVAPHPLHTCWFNTGLCAPSWFSWPSSPPRLLPISSPLPPFPPSPFPPLFLLLLFFSSSPLHLFSLLPITSIYSFTVSLGLILLREPAPHDNSPSLPASWLLW